MANRIRMAKLSDLPPGKIIEKRILARRIAVVNDNGKLYGIESDCKHMRASLAKGTIADGVITCRWHGWRYGLADGVCLTHPEFSLKRFEIEIDGDDIYLIM